MTTNAAPGRSENTAASGAARRQPMTTGSPTEAPRPVENAEKMAPGEFQAPTEMPPLEKVSPGAKEAPAAKPASVEKSSLREKAETTAKPASIPSRALILFNQKSRPSLPQAYRETWETKERDTPKQLQPQGCSGFHFAAAQRLPPTSSVGLWTSSSSVTSESRPQPEAPPSSPQPPRRRARSVRDRRMDRRHALFPQPPMMRIAPPCPEQQANCVAGPSSRRRRLPHPHGLVVVPNRRLPARCGRSGDELIGPLSVHSLGPSSQRPS